MGKDNVMHGNAGGEPTGLRDQVAAEVAVPQQVRRDDADAHAAAAERLLGLVGRDADLQRCRGLKTAEKTACSRQQCGEQHC